MSQGIRATVSFDRPDGCLPAALSEAAETSIVSNAANVSPTVGSESVSEFTVDAAHESPDELTPVFEHGQSRRYRMTHDRGIVCPCERLGASGCPIDRYIARDGELTLVFHAKDYEELREVVASLRDMFPDVDVKRFVRSPASGDSSDPVRVDRGRLTARQLEVVERAYEMGYFERPRETNASEVAASLDIDPSTLTEHLSSAQSKLLGDVLQKGP